MADGTNIIPLRSSREVAWKAGLRVVEGHPQSNVGPHSFPGLDPVPPMARVEVTGASDGYRVWLLGRPYRDFATLSNASRCASALMTLDALDALACTEPTPPEAA